MDLQELTNSKMFEVVRTEGRNTLILRQPVKIVVPQTILNYLASIYPKNSETGGFLLAEANTTTGTLAVKKVVALRNYSTVDTSFQPLTNDYNRAIQDALNAGLLPMRFHSHPVSTVNDLYNIQSLDFFQKTSATDRHTSYLPLMVNGQAIVLPDCLVSPNDRHGETIRFSIYNGFIAPNSFAALLPNEQVFIGFVALVLLVVWATLGKKQALTVFVVCGLLAVLVFIKEKRPSYDYTVKGLTITV